MEQDVWRLMYKVQAHVQVVSTGRMTIIQCDGHSTRFGIYQYNLVLTIPTPSQSHWSQTVNHGKMHFADRRPPKSQLANHEIPVVCCDESSTVNAILLLKHYRVSSCYLSLMYPRVVVLITPFPYGVGSRFFFQIYCHRPVRMCSLAFIRSPSVFISQVTHVTIILYGQLTRWFFIIPCVSFPEKIIRSFVR